MSNQTFVQWNVQGMGSSKEDVLKLIDRYEPLVFAGQETYYSSNFISNISGYKAICKQGSFNRRYYGGVVLYIHTSYPSRERELNSEYEIVAAQISISRNKTITIASIYIPGREPLREEYLRDIMDLLPRPFVVLGDINAHHTDWGNRETDARGRIIWHILNDLKLSVIKDGRPTHISGSAIDLTIASPDITPNCRGM